MNDITQILYQNILQEFVLERTIYTYAYLSVLLYSIPSGKQWSYVKDLIIDYSRHTDFGYGCLPFLDVSTITKARLEKNKIKESLDLLFEARSIRGGRRRMIQLARARIFDNYLVFFIQSLPSFPQPLTQLPLPSLPSLPSLDYKPIDS